MGRWLGTQGHRLPVGNHSPTCPGIPTAVWGLALRRRMHAPLSGGTHSLTPPHRPPGSTSSTPASSTTGPQRSLANNRTLDIQRPYAFSVKRLG